MGAAQTSLPRGHLGPSGLLARPARARGSPAAIRLLSADTARVTFGAGNGWKQPGVSGLDQLPREITTPAAGGSLRIRKGSGGQRPVPSARGPLYPCLGPESGYRRGPRADPFYSLTFLQSGLPGREGAGRAAWGILTPSALSHLPGAPRVRATPPGHRVRATLDTATPPSRGPWSLSSLPPGQAPPPWARPGRCFPQSQAETPRPFPPAMQRGGLRISRHRLPQLQRPPAAPAPWPSPGARTLLSICFTIFAAGV